MAIQVILEFRAQPGKRDELKKLSQGIAAQLGPSEPSFLGSAYYESLDNPDVLVEIADWESAETRAVAVQKAMEMGAYAPVMEILAEPFRATAFESSPDHGWRGRRSLGVFPEAAHLKMNYMENHERCDTHM